MNTTSKIAWKNSGVEVYSIHPWLKEKHIEIEIGNSNLPVATNRYDPEYKKYRFELVDEPKY